MCAEENTDGNQPFREVVGKYNRKAEGNIARVDQRLAELPTEAITDALELGFGICAVATFLARTYNMKVWGTDYDQAQSLLNFRG